MTDSTYTTLSSLPLGVPSPLPNSDIVNEFLEYKILYTTECFPELPDLCEYFTLHETLESLTEVLGDLRHHIQRKTPILAFSSVFTTLGLEEAILYYLFLIQHWEEFVSDLYVYMKAEKEDAVSALFVLFPLYLERFKQKDPYPDIIYLDEIEEEPFYTLEDDIIEDRESEMSGILFLPLTSVLKISARR